MYYVYVLLSLHDGRRYIGSTNDLQRRLRQHMTGQVRATSPRLPLKLLYTELYDTKQNALARERFFKTHKGYNELQRLLSGIGAAG